MKIFHVVENLDFGAVENWLVNTFLCSRAIRPDWEWTFYCMLGIPGRLDSTVTQAGGLIIYSPVTISKKWAFLKHLRKSLLAKKYDILHVHHDYLSGFYLLSSWGIIFKRRILHIHNNDKALPVGNGLLRKLLLKPFQWLGFYLSDTIIGISKNTLQEFAGSDFKKRSKNCKVLYYGIDMSFFKRTSSYSIKQELNIPPTARLVLFIGRLNKFKNPLFVLDIAAEIIKTRKDIYFLFIGRGDLEQTLVDRIKVLNLESQTRFLGWRNDTASIMKQADLFLFPRLEEPKEGLGLVVVEAQSAGLPMFLTNGIVEDAVVIPELVNIMSLNDHVEVWAEQVIQKLNQPVPLSRKEALNRMVASQFELFKATQHLIELYEESQKSN